MCKDLSDSNESVTDQTITDESTEAVDPSAGERLRAAREAKALDLRDVALQTRQSQDTLAALESEQTAHIPDSILRLQARNYARFLGLPEEEIASAYADARGSLNADAMPVEVAAPRAFPKKTLMIGSGALAAALVLVGGVAILLSGPQPQTGDQLAISARLAPAFEQPTDLSALRADVSEEFFIHALEPAWIEVRGSDGTVFRNRQMQAGETYYPRTGAGWTITVRNAGAFEWRLGDTPVGRIGTPDQALYSVSIDNAMTAAEDARTAALAETTDGSRRPR